MSKKIKYYRLEELKVGMRVSVDSLYDINGVAIYLDKSTFEYDDDVTGYGTIVCIGYENYNKSGLTSEDVIVISHINDMSSDEILDFVED